MEGIPNHVPAGTEAGACRSGGGGTSIYADEEHDAHIRGLANFIEHPHSKVNIPQAQEPSSARSPGLADSHWRTRQAATKAH